MQIRWLLAGLMLAGFGIPSNPSVSLGSAEAAPALSNAAPMAGARLPPASADESGLRYYPLSNYRRYPPSIRPLLQRHELENDRCAGIKPDSRACNRADRIYRQLERLGWCWGSVDAGAAEADKYWLRCSLTPYYRRAAEARRHSARPIREMRREAAH